MKFQWEMKYSRIRNKYAKGYGKDKNNGIKGYVEKLGIQKMGLTRFGGGCFRH